MSKTFVRQIVERDENGVITHRRAELHDLEADTFTVIAPEGEPSPSASKEKEEKVAAPDISAGC